MANATRTIVLLMFDVIITHGITFLDMPTLSSYASLSVAATMRQAKQLHTPSTFTLEVKDINRLIGLEPESTLQ